VLESVVQKLMTGLTPDDVSVAIEAGCGEEMHKLVDALGWLAFRWWTAPGEKDPNTVKEIQNRLAKLQLMWRHD
jgi:hypothetical protein